MTHVLFICLGNICHSPTVEAVARAEFARAGLDVEVDSAGTAGYHVGAPPDPRSIAAGAALRDCARLETDVISTFSNCSMDSLLKSALAICWPVVLVTVIV